jgi:hypothetical protein
MLRRGWPLLLALLLAACSATRGGRDAGLLNQDFLAMSDPRLVAYEQALSDEIARAAGNGAGGVSLGVGFGTWGDHSAIGVGIDRYLGGGSGAFPALVQRRDEVRAEMLRRGLITGDQGAP